MKNLSNKVFLLIVLTILFFSCSTTSNLSEKQNQISVGQTKDEVIAILGNPGNKQLYKKAEAWQYCSIRMSSDLFVVVWFLEGIVYGLSTYHSDYIGSCEGAFKQIDWQEEANKTFEIRNR